MITASQFTQLFVEDTALLDVRAPVEYAQGAFPGTTNIPLLDDEQRRQVGTRYKEAGQDQAIALGWELASDAMIQSRQRDWVNWIEENPNGVLYCFRGGLRSRLSLELINKAGAHIEYIEGGYKALRRFLLDTLEACEHVPMLLVRGQTGSGKTRALIGLRNAVDLEALANHRGSAFGKRFSPQPGQIDFENSIAVQLLKRSQEPALPAILEDEGRLIGRLSLPQILQQAMLQSPFVTLTTDVEQRIDFALKDYVLEPLQQLRELDTGNIENKLHEYLLGNLYRIRKRLGGALHQQLERNMKDAIKKLLETGESSEFRPIIESLLCDYYDPMYRYQMEKHRGTELFRGDLESVRDFLTQYHLDSNP